MNRNRWVAPPFARKIILASFGAWALLLPIPARAQSGMISQFLPQLDATTSALTKALVTTVGFGFDHRALRPATALGKGTEMGIEVVGAKFPSTLGPALAGAGFNDSSNLEVGIVPAPKLFFKRGLGENLSLGLSGLKYSDILIYGFDFQYTLAQPEEGINIALRLSYNRAEVVYMKTHTFTPSVVISRALDFIDPYLGLSYQYTRGDLTLEIEPVPGISTTIKDFGTDGCLNAWIGTQFKPSALGLILDLEGGYSTASMHWMALRLGFGL